MKKNFIYLFIIMFIISCGTEQIDPVEKNTAINSNALFSRLDSTKTKINFKNEVVQTAQRNTLYYSYMFNGSGVAIADINNDKLPDVFFCGNQVKNKLYLNKGGLKFHDISSHAKIEGLSINKSKRWSVGVSVVDINNDGFLDFYISNGGPYNDKKNELYVNNGDLSFTERASEYGIDDNSYSIQSTFFDYDKDGDLDLYVLNHPPYFNIPIDKIYETIKNNPSVLQEVTGKFFINTGNKFEEATTSVGLANYSYGLGVVANDLNNDGWVDLYLSNDFSSPDRMMINQKNGTFKDEIKQRTNHISYYGMGCDVADLNNDGNSEIFVVDMTTEDHIRSKTLMPSMQPEVFRGLVEYYKFHHQYMFNTLQLNKGNGTYSEVAQFAGLHKTDWSWSPHLVDFDNDGLRDVFITNGWLQDTKNNDFLNEYRKRKKELGVRKIPKSEIMDWVAKIPSQKTKNYMYKNKGNLEFKNTTDEWGFSDKSFSNGASVADLDLDGDLDIVINNLNQEAFIYENNSRSSNSNNFIKIRLIGDDKDKLALNAKIKLKTDQNEYIYEQTLSRGYASSVEPLIHIGVGQDNPISLEVVWLDGTASYIENITSNSTITVSKKNKEIKKNNLPTEEKNGPIFVKKNKGKGLNLVHKENIIDEFEKEILLPHNQSNHGPIISLADFNNDNLDDIFFPGSYGFPSQTLIQLPDGSFKNTNNQIWENSKQFEDVSASFFDYDNDGDLDIYVCTGGAIEVSDNNKNFQLDRFYLNDGKGNFKLNQSLIPSSFSSGTIVSPGDYNQDGRIDLFINGRLDPGKYPQSGTSQLLKNTEKGFVNVIQDIAPKLEKLGMISDMVWTDYDQDNDLDIIVVGEWMGITILKNDEGNFNQIITLDNSVGWWNRIVQYDFDQDGDQDYIVGNVGLNNKFINKTGKEIEIFGNDFDNNGSLDIVLANKYKEDLVPVRGKECSSQQMPFISEKFEKYSEFATASLSDIYGEEKLNQSIHYKANEFRSLILENKNNDNFETHILPYQAQIFPIKDLIIKDVDQDNILDLVLAGNHFGVEVESVRYDAGGTILLKGLGDFKFEYVPSNISGLTDSKDARSIRLLKHNKKDAIIISNNNDELIYYNLGL